MDGLFAGIMSFGMIGFENLSAYRVGAPLNKTPIKVNENMKYFYLILGKAGTKIDEQH